MNTTLQDTVWRTFIAPRDAARQILGWDLGWPTVLLVIATGIAVDLLITQVLMMDLPETLREDPIVVLQGTSFGGVALRVAAVFTVSALVTWIGRAFGGSGDLPRVTSAVAWVGLASALLGIVQLVGHFLIPPLMGIVNIALGLLGLWILACFVAEAHRFASTPRVAAALLGFAILITLVLMLVVSLGTAGA